jgi:hypothetical protein
VEEALVSAISPETPSPIYRYRVAAVLPPELEEVIRTALEAFELGPAERGLFQWQAPFRSEQPHAVAGALDEWARNNLPIATQAAQVHSEVIGAQTYVAGWKLTNAEAIHKAQNALTVELAPFIEPEPDAPASFRAVIPLKASLPPNRLPHIVGYLQKHFKPHDWLIEAVELLRAPIPAEGETAQPEVVEQWEVAGAFKPGV